MYGNCSVSRKKFTHVINIHYRIAEETAAEISFHVDQYKVGTNSSVRTNWDVIPKLNLFICSYLWWLFI